MSPLTSSAQPCPADQARSRAALATLAAVLLLGSLIQVRAGRASLFGLHGPRCVVGEWVGPAGCPGCGLTRSVALTLHGELSAAAQLNWAGIGLVFLCVAGILVHLDILLRAGRRTARHRWLLRVGTHTFAASLLFAWIYRLLSF